MIKKLLQIAAIILFAGICDAAPPMPVPSFEALLIQRDGSSQKAFLVTATKASIRFREAKDSAEVKDRKLSDFVSVHIAEPRDFTIAVDLFQSRRYQEAKAAFAILKTNFEPISTLPDNPGTLSAFYELECFRKLGDLQGLSEALKKFNKDPLVRENHLRQIEMYIFWDAVRTKNWGRLESLVKDRQKQRLPGYQRAQVSYCHAVALEGLGKPKEALDAYNIALTADLGASEEIARRSALAILRIHQSDPLVKEALKQSKNPAEDRESEGYARLNEARAIAKLFELSLGAGESLPKEFEIFLN
jgi:tetratricopeptide (TPR) repeat protein